MLMPNIGRLCRKSGSKAQWMAQASEALIPKASQLNFIFMSRQKYARCNSVAKHLLK